MISQPRRLHVSKNDIIYLSAADAVYQTTNEGVSWSLTFKSPKGWKCFEVIKITTDHSDEFWLIGKKNYKWQVCVYNMKNKLFDDMVKWSEVNLPTPNGQQIQLNFSRLSYDSNMNIFLSDYDNNAIHVFSVKNQQYLQLLSAQLEKPCSLQVDNANELLYVGELAGVVKVFQFT